MYETADEVRVFGRLGYEDLAYDTESGFETYIETLISLVSGLLDQFRNVPKGFFEAGDYTQSSELYDYLETRALQLHVAFQHSFPSLDYAYLSDENACTHCVPLNRP